MPEPKEAKTVDQLLQEFRGLRAERMALEKELERENPAAQTAAAHSGDPDELDRLARRAVTLPALIRAKLAEEVQAAKRLEGPWLESLTSEMAGIGAEKAQAHGHYNSLPQKHHEELVAALAVVADADRRLIAAENEWKAAQAEIKASRETAEGKRPV